MTPTIFARAIQAVVVIAMVAAALAAVLWYVFTLIETPVYRLVTFFLLGILFSNIAAKVVNASTRRI